jgi:hypothetical protein
MNNRGNFPSELKKKNTLLAGLSLDLVKIGRKLKFVNKYLA